MKHKFLKRVIAIALSFTLAAALFSPLAVSAAEVIFSIEDFSSLSLTSDGEFVNGTGLQRKGWGQFTGTSMSIQGGVLVVTEGGAGGKGIQLSPHHAGDQMFQGVTGNEYRAVLQASAVSGAGQITMRADNHTEPNARLDAPLTANRETFTIEWVQVAHEHNNLQIFADVDFNVYSIVVSQLPAGTVGAEATAADDEEDAEEDEEAYDEEVDDEEDEDEVVEDDEEDEAEEQYVPIVPIEEEVVAPQTVTIQLTVGNTTMVVNGVGQTLEVAPVIESGRTMVPFRALGDAMGAVVDFDPVTRTASYVLGGQTLELVLGVELPDNMGTPEVVDGRTLVPVRFVTEFFGAELTVDLPNITIVL